MLTALFDRMTRLSLRFNWLTIAISLILMVGGGLALTQLNQELLPRIEFPQTIVIAQWGEAEDANQFLEEVTIPLENVVSDIEGVVNVESTTNQGFAFLIIRNEFGLNQQTLVTRIEEAVAEASLPEGMDLPQVLDFSLSDLPVVIFSVSSSEMSLAELKELVESDLQADLADIADVSEVVVTGGQELPSEDVVAEDEGEEIAAAEPTPTAEPTATPTVEPTATPDPARLPDALIQGAAGAGLSIEFAQDITPDMMRQIAGFGPMASQFFALLTPDNLRLLQPEAIALLPADFLTTLDSDLVAELDELAADFGGAGQLLIAEAEAAAEETPTAPQIAAVTLPESWIGAAATFGLPISTTAQIDATFAGGIIAQAPALLADLEPEMWRAFSPEVLALMVPVAELDTDLLAQLTAIQNAAAGVPPTPIALPAELVQGAAAVGQTISTTADLTPEFVQMIIQFAPESIGQLPADLLLALPPETLAVIPAELLATLDPGLQQTITNVLVYAAANQPTEEIAAGDSTTTTLSALPESVVQTIALGGLEVAYAQDITPEMMRMLAGFGPQAIVLLEQLTPENLLALQPEVIALLPADFVAGLDADLKSQLDELAAEFGGAGVLAAEEAANADPARLPDALIQGAAQAGLTIEFAQDLTPDFMKLLGGLGPQAAQALSLLTPDHLRLLQPETIGWLPVIYLDTLDAELRAELDVLAAEFGGAGALAVAAEAEAEALSAGAPILSGIWLEPDAQGNPSQFETAADILNNPFIPGAAAFLNVFPSSPQVEDPRDWLGALTPEILQWLADNEEGFAASLDPVVLEYMSPEGLTFLLDTYPDAFDADLTERLRGIAAGDVEVFIPEASITRANGNPALLISVFKAGDANTVTVAHAIFDLLDQYTAEHANLEYEIGFEQATFIEDAISGVSGEGLRGGLFAVLVILIFLSGHVRGKYRLSWRAVLVTGISIPLSILSAILFMRWVPVIGQPLNDAVTANGNSLLRFFSQLLPTEVTLNIMTLSGLTVAIGRVVDDSIVVLENSYRFIQQGYTPREAAIAATKEVAIAIFAATATTVAVFLPLGLVGGLISSFFLPFGLTVTYSLIASFVVAITVVPVLTALFITKDNIPEEKETAMQRWYTPVLAFALKNRVATLAITVVFFGLSLYLMNTLPKNFIPGLGEATVNVTISLPSGTTMADTDTLVQEFEVAIADLEGVESVRTEVGGGGGLQALFLGGGAVSQNQANVTLSVSEELLLNQDALGALTIDVRQEAEVVFGGPDFVTVSTGTQAGFSGYGLVLEGIDLNSTQLAEIVAEVKATIAAVDTDENGSPDVVNITSNVDDALAGGSSSIIRIDGKPAVSFGGSFEFGLEDTIGAAGQIRTDVAALSILPADVIVSEGFEAEQQTQGFQGVLTAIGWASLLVYLIMALSFRSLIHPLVILFSLPLSVIGAALALFLTGRTLGISSMIGLLMLVGIITTNGIVLMELVKQLRERGNSVYDALIKGGRTRLRPIWMTALATILALIPLALSAEAGAIIAADLAWTVLGGLLVGTLLTLVIIPVVYSLIEEILDRFRKKA
ncbi:MAG: efflux RND transporter permease subunit [Candidatus Promineifilaceae bacterium]